MITLSCEQEWKVRIMIIKMILLIINFLLFFIAKRPLARPFYLFQIKP